MGADNTPADDALLTVTVDVDNPATGINFGATDISASAEGSYYEVWGTNIDHWGGSSKLGSTATGQLTTACCSALRIMQTTFVYFAGQYSYYLILTRAQVEVDAIQGSTGDFVDWVYTTTGDVWDLYGEPDGYYANLGYEAYHEGYASITVLENADNVWAGCDIIHR